MMPPALLVLFVKATIVLVLALAITRGLQRAPAGARHLVWLASLGALLLVPALGAWGPLHIAVLPAARPTSVGAPPVQGWGAAARSQNEVPAVAVEGAPLATFESEPDAATPAAFARAGRRLLDAVPGVSTVLALWAAVAVAIGAMLAKAWLAVHRIVRRARPLSTPDWLDPLYEIADRLGLDEPPRLLRSADAKMPFACGLRRPTIVLPAESDAWTLDRRRAVLLHELAHVRRRDLAGHTLARIVCAVYWFHPLVWTAAKRLRAESERACDDLALTSGARASDYAEHLLDIVTTVRRDATPVVALAMARRAEFEGRMLDILDPERPRTAPSRRQGAALVGTLALVTVVVGAAAPTARGPAAGPQVAKPWSGGADSAGEGDHAVSVTAGRVTLRAPAGGAAVLEAAPARATVQATSESVRAVARAEARAAADPSGFADADVPAAADRAAARTPTQPGAGADDRAALLARVLRTDTSASLRRIAAWGLAEHAEHPAAIAALAAALRTDASATVREMAAWALADADRSAAAGDALTAALRADADPGVRATAAWTLGNIGDVTAVDVLTAALSDRSPEVRTRATWALGNVEPRRAPRPLVALLGDADANVRKLAAWALFQIEDPAAVPALQAALRSERDSELQVAYVRALAVLGEQSVDALRGLLDSPDPQLKAVAVRALAGGHAAGPWPRPWPQPRPFP